MTKNFYLRLALLEVEPAPPPEPKCGKSFIWVATAYRNSGTVLNGIRRAAAAEKERWLRYTPMANFLRRLKSSKRDDW
jgi:hypothetical protein